MNITISYCSHQRNRLNGSVWAIEAMFWATKMAANNGLEETKLNKDYTLVYSRTTHHRQLYTPESLENSKKISEVRPLFKTRWIHIFWLCFLSLNFLDICCQFAAGSIEISTFVIESWTNALKQVFSALQKGQFHYRHRPRGINGKIKSISLIWNPFCLKFFLTLWCRM